MTPPAKNLICLDGGNALSDFRARALLARLRSINPHIAALGARHVHWVWSDAALADADSGRLRELLRYGDAAPAAADEGALVVVAPRLGTVSPWASKATPSFAPAS